MEAVILIIVIGLVGYLGFLTTLKNTAKTVNKSLEKGNEFIDKKLDIMEVDWEIDNVEIEAEQEERINALQTKHNGRLPSLANNRELLKTLRTKSTEAK